MRKQVLQKHQVLAFNKSLIAIEHDLVSKIRFIDSYHEVYKFPIAVVRQNMREYKRQLKAVQKLKSYAK